MAKYIDMARYRYGQVQDRYGHVLDVVARYRIGMARYGIWTGICTGMYPSPLKTVENRYGL